MAAKSRYVVLEDHRTLIGRVVSIYHLAVELTKAELRTRQFQRLLGPIWWIVEPSMMSVVFYFLTTRLNYTTGPNHFMFIFIGTMTWRMFSRSIENSVGNYITYTYVIRQLSFPLLAANLCMVFTELVFFACGFAALIVLGFALSSLSAGASWLLLPFLVLTQALLTLGAAIIVACVGVYLRDISTPIGIALNIAFFFSPAIYEADKVPARLAWLEYVNPFFYLFPAYRSILIRNEVPPILPWVLWTLAGVGLILAALALYRALRPNFLRVL